MKCRHCRAKAISCDFYGSEMKEPYLFRCTKTECKRFFWHRNILKEFDSKEEPSSEKNKKIEDKLVKKFKIPKSSYPRGVYVIELSRNEGDKKGSVYVGETGRHPLRRYLQHIRGYKNGKGYATKRGKYLLYFELGVKDSKLREKELGEELRDKYIVFGGH
tara:strand:- start:114 stop:596 length:483 start_codon:yes stop_codon:yes gene_type:complete